MSKRVKMIRERKYVLRKTLNTTRFSKANNNIKKSNTSTKKNLYQGSHEFLAGPKRINSVASLIDESYIVTDL